VQLDLGLQGNRSAYGDFRVYLVNGRRERLIAQLKSFALYFPYSSETVRIATTRVFSRSDFSESSRLRVKFYNKSPDSEKVLWLDDSIVPNLD